MIKTSFIFLPGIGYKKERELSLNYNWNSFLKTSNIEGIGVKRKVLYDSLIKKAKDALLNDDVGYLARIFPLSEHYRFYKYYRDDAVFLDIEVTHVTGELSVIGLYDGYRSKTMIAGYNLDLDFLRKELSRYKVIVTYNGNTFDLPYLRKKYDLIPDVLCIDLKVVCARLGFVGGLKQIEKELGIERKNGIVSSIRGGDAAKLFRMWKGSGDSHYLKQLVEYNEEDTLNLQTIADKLVPLLDRKRPI